MSDRTLIFNQEETDELLSLLEQGIDEHSDVVQELTKDDSTTAEQFRTCIADENHRQIIRVRLRAMLKGGEM